VVVCAVAVVDTSIGGVIIASAVMMGGVAAGGGWGEGRETGGETIAVAMVGGVTTVSGATAVVWESLMMVSPNNLFHKRSINICLRFPDKDSKPACAHMTFNLSTFSALRSPASSNQANTQTKYMSIISIWDILGSLGSLGGLNPPPLVSTM
jgi:hypothetical protein